MREAQRALAQAVRTLERRVRAVDPEAFLPAGRRPRRFDRAERTALKLEADRTDIFDFNLKAEGRGASEDALDIPREIPR